MERRPPDFEKILAQRAVRLGIPIAEIQASAISEPRFVAAAIDKGTATSSDDVLLEDSHRRQQSTYPTEECLEPHEVELCLLGQLDSARMKHLESCTACNALIAACQPSEARLQRFMDEVRKLSISALGRPEHAAGLRSLLELLEK